MTESNRCPQCGTELPADAPAGVCPRCILALGLHGGPPLASTAPATPSGRFVPPKLDELAPLFPQLEILGLLGQGGMGAVYKARQPKLDRLVALKILPPEVGQDPAFAERFAREARTLARLSHLDVVAIHDFGQAGGLYYLLMEYVDGPNLRQLIEGGKLAPQEALAIVPKICEALQYAHDEGVVHRDIKPENILLDRKGRVKIADFGLAKMLGRPAGNFTLTDTHQVMGTPHYMAPEQVQGSHAVDHRADIYSLGVVFYEMLTGELPLGRFEPPSKKVSIDMRLDEVVLRALERSPERRYQQASEVKTDVETISRAIPAVLPPMATSDEEDKLAEARFLVRGPAIGLMVIGVLAWLQSLAYVLFGSFQNRPDQFFQDPDFIALPFMAAASIPYGAVMFVAGWQMLRLRTYTLGVLAGVMAYVVPLGILPLIAWPVAIWTHIVLWKQTVKDSFAINLRRRIVAARTDALQHSEAQETSSRQQPAAPPKPTRGTIGRAWDEWWAQRDRWFANSVQSVLALVFLACLLMYLNFHISTTPTPGDAKLRHTTVQLGSPSPWFHLETYPNPRTPFQWRINYFSSSSLVVLLGCVAWYVCWQIEKAKPDAQHLWLGSVNTILIFWFVVTILAVAWGMHPMFMDLGRQ